MDPSAAGYTDILGTYYALRHELGFYLSAAVSASYRCPNNTAYKSAAVVQATKTALTKTVRRHPILRIGVGYDVAQSRANYVQHDTLSLNNVLRFRCPVSTKQHDSFASELERHHAEAFPDPNHDPSWRVTLLRSLGTWEDDLTSDSMLHVIFNFHHTLIDGLSGLVFHKTFGLALLDALASTSGPVPGNIIHCVEPVILPPRLESFNAELPQVLYPEPSTVSPIRRCRTAQMSIRYLEIPAELITATLQICRTHQVTLTGVLQGVVVSILARISKGHVAVKGIIPCSMRKYTDASADDMVMHISYMESRHPQALTDAFVACKPGSKQDGLIILQVAKLFKIDAHQSSEQRNSPLIVRRAAQVLPILMSSPEQLLQRDSNALTYELSNLGVVRSTPRSVAAEPDTTPLKLQGYTFSQSGPEVGLDLGVNCVTLEGGQMSVCITWSEDTRHLVNGHEVSLGLISQLTALCS